MFYLHFAFGCDLLVSQGNIYTSQKACYVLHRALVFLLRSPFIHRHLHCMCVLFLCFFAQRWRVRVIKVHALKWEEEGREVIWGVSLRDRSSPSTWWTGFSWFLRSGVHLALAWVDHSVPCLHQEPCGLGGLGSFLFKGLVILYCVHFFCVLLLQGSLFSSQGLDKAPHQGVKKMYSHCG